MYEQDFFLEVLDWLTEYADHEPDWADACLAILSGRDKIEVMDLRPGVPNQLAPAERDHSLGLELAEWPGKFLEATECSETNQGTSEVQPVTLTASSVPRSSPERGR
jgi:hypothetical protein